MSLIREIPNITGISNSLLPTCFLSNKPRFLVISGRVIMRYNTVERQKRKTDTDRTWRKVWQRKSGFQKWIDIITDRENNVSKNWKGSDTTETEERMKIMCTIGNSWENNEKKWLRDFTCLSIIAPSAL